MTLPDGRTGRHFLVGGVPSRAIYGRGLAVNPKDLLNSAYPTVQMQGYWYASDGDICKVNPFWKRDPNHPSRKFVGLQMLYRAKGALQVTLCKGGMIEGVSKLALVPPR